METVVCDIAKNRMVKDFNTAFKELGLFVTSIRFEEKNGLSVIIEISSNDNLLEITVV